LKIGKSCCGSYLRIAISVRRRSKGMLEGKKGVRSTFLAIHQGFFLHHSAFFTIHQKIFLHHSAFFLILYLNL
jgi:hypothetical protein